MVVEDHGMFHLEVMVSFLIQHVMSTMSAVLGYYRKQVSYRLRRNIREMQATNATVKHRHE